MHIDKPRAVLLPGLFHGKRTDLDINACTIGQLKYKPEGREDEDA